MYGEFFCKKLQMRECEPSDFKAITTVVTPGVTIDFFPPFLFLSCFLSIAPSLFPTHWQLVCSSEAAGAPTTWGSTTLKSQTNEQQKLTVKSTVKGAHTHTSQCKGTDYIMSLRAKQLALATSANHVFTNSNM